MSPTDWLDLIWRHLTLSLLAVGGAITLAPALHQYHVGEHAWLSEAEFAQALTLAQAAPGPNALFIALLGWQVGLHSAAGGPWWWQGLCGLAAALAVLAALLLPSSLLTLTLTRWTQRHRQHLGVRAFRQGLAPVVVGVLGAASMLLLQGQSGGRWPEARWAVAGVVMLLVWRTKLHLLWMLAAGAALGSLGYL
ncbi:chromate transporter [Ideonella livida]|uniref:Chromate transporter n=1 Tax=Ideonella livida TaxID=2707176 RepID=A0A7C9PIV5_9BURK|nr:chromate transporter [Ideonella livida]NDY93117.1 chromate transporter [Ideonella livida]